ncbi:PadR family transcriptional regulator [Tepidimicrobium xylanilyticum]|uniref:PadR family transcriptional regulator n=1 Tax=Tepidimicrobium xylanilyticum TaxID=1123352 RepID=UPI00264D2D79|nr:helix-turn-helix transcriptional regulator [Tepidimicrobium xylanilyticum]GMG97421.1 PadR family transcriptional regulator [Tepidimicrobium xylanilyticum]
MKQRDIRDKIPLTETALLLLLALYKPNHGYNVMKMVKKMTEERIIFGPGTLYGAINNLNKKGWIKLVRIDKESKKKEYVITDTSKKIVEMELARMKQMYDAGKKIIKGVNALNGD